MILPFNCDHPIHRRASRIAGVESAVRNALSHYHGRIPRVEVHLNDENGGKSGGNDIRCLMESPLAGLPPLAGTHPASGLDQGVDGADQKIKAAVDHPPGKLQPHRNEPVRHQTPSCA